MNKVDESYGAVDGPSASTSVLFQVLGPVRVHRDGDSVSVGGLKQRSILALLIANVGEPVSLDRIVDGIYAEDAGAGARRSVQTFISVIRREVGDVVRKDRSGYVLAVDPESIDAVRFEHQVRTAVRLAEDDPEAAAVALRDALSMWRGHPYADVDGRGVFEPEIKRLAELRRSALEARIDADLATGGHLELLGELDALTAEYPLQERFRAQQMLALYRASRQTEALRAYSRARAYLVEEIGIEPSTELRQLEQQILDQDPGLNLPVAPSVTERVVVAIEVAETADLTRLEPDERASLVQSLSEVVAASVERHDGEGFAQRGSAMYAAFPTVGDALRTVSEAIVAPGPALPRVALDRGDVELHDSGDVTGPPLRRAAGLVAAAHPGQVLLSAEAQLALAATEEPGWAIRSLGSHLIYGIYGSQLVFQLDLGEHDMNFPPLRIDATPPPLPTDRRAIAGYELRRPIATDLTGTTYRAYQPSVGREVAVTVIDPAWANEAEFIRRFEVETQLVSRMQHPNIVPILDYWRDPTGAYLVAPSMNSTTLAKRLEAGEIDEELCRQLIFQVGAALSYAHHLGIVHGTVSPDSIMLDESANAYLTAAAIVMRLAGAPRPTSAYSSPEQQRGDPISTAADVYGLGVLASQLLPVEGLGEVIGRATADQADTRFTSVDELLLGLGPALGPVESAARFTETRNPYRGLEAFRETDAGDFFGRDDTVEGLTATLAEHRLVAVVGPSGSGKSSLVKAGLVPAVRGGALGPPEPWLVTDLFPGPYPFEELESALARVAVKDPGSLVEELEGDDRGLVRVIKRILPADTRLVLIIDQFEELFTLTRDDAARDLFLRALVELVTDERSDTRVVVTLRADFLDQPLQHPDFGALVKAGLFLLTPPSSEQLTEAVRRPAEGLGITWEPGLVEQIVDDVTDAPGTLPLLQYALTEVFAARQADQLTHDGYRAAGGVLGALGSRADDVFAQLDSRHQDLARQLFLRLVTVQPTGGQTRRRARLPELSAIADPGHVNTVLAAFGDARLLTFDRDPMTRAPTVEVAHEALLTRWTQLDDWTNEAREDLVLRQRLDDAVDEWGEREQADSHLLTGGRLAQFQTWADDSQLTLTANEADYLARSTAQAGTARARRRRRRNLITAGFAVVAVVATVLGIAALISRQDAADQADLAAEQALAAQELATRAEELAVAAQEQTDLAEERAVAASVATDRADLATLISRSGEVSADEPALAILLALEANRRAPGPDSERAVLNGLSRSTLGTRIATFAAFPAEIQAGSDGILTRDGLSESDTDDGRMFRRDLVTGEVIEVGVLPAPDTRWVGDQATDRGFVQSLDQRRMWFGPYAGPWEVELEVDPLSIVSAPSLWVNRLVFQTNAATYLGDGLWESRVDDPVPDIVVLDATTGQPVGPGLTASTIQEVAISSDGQSIAISTGNEFADEPNLLHVLDMATGEEEFAVPLPDTVAEMIFDPSGDQLLGATVEGRLLTVDLTERVVVAEVDTNASSRVVGVGLRSDGRVVVVSNGLAEMVDRLTGPIPGTGIELRDTIDGVMRADDTLAVWNTELRIDVHDFEGSAMSEQSIDIPDDAGLVLGSGSEAVLGREAGFERLNLVSEGGTPIDLSHEEGDFFLPERLEPSGILGLGPATNTLARWEDGIVVDEVSIFGPDVSFLGGSRIGNRHAYGGLRPDGSVEHTVVQVGVEGLAVLVSVVETEDTCMTFPAPADGIYTIFCDGRIRTYDSTGSVTDETDTGRFNLFLPAGDEASGLLALGGAGSIGPILSGAIIFDPATQEVELLPDIDAVANLTFARDGEILAILSPDGTVRLWDVQRRDYVGVIWDGTGANLGDPLWYDEGTDSLWLQSEGRLVRLPLDPARWLERACELVGRDFTQEEWDRFVPGDEPLQSACS